MLHTEISRATDQFVARIRQEGLAAEVGQIFSELYGKYRNGDKGKLRWSDISAPKDDDIVDYEEMMAAKYLARGESLLDRVVCIKLNGGLGTTMKLDRAKSLIPVREGRSFLQLVVDQIGCLNRRYGSQTPLLLLNSFRTQSDCLAHLAEACPELSLDGIDFLQNKFPRIAVESGLPSNFEAHEENWAPPGHGDIYLALQVSGQLDRLLQAGYRWAFVSNVDNLSATVDPAILGYLDQQSMDFAMEVTDKTAADIKGGTLVRYDGRLMLLEGAQVDDGHVADFQDLKRFSVFNTNSLWWRLDAMHACLKRGDLHLPMIVNPKQTGGIEVVQLELAMGAAIGSFERALGVRVPRRRFTPVKGTVDLLALRSDAYAVGEDGGIRPSAGLEGAPPLIQLDPKYYQGIADFESRFAHTPSLRNCQSLKVEGDVIFGADVVCSGNVAIRNSSGKPQRIADGAQLNGIVEIT